MIGNSEFTYLNASYKIVKLGNLGRGLVKQGGEG